MTFSEWIQCNRRWIKLYSDCIRTPFTSCHFNRSFIFAVKDQQCITLGDNTKTTVVFRRADAILFEKRSKCIQLLAIMSSLAPYAMSCVHNILHDWQPRPFEIYLMGVFVKETVPWREKNSKVIHGLLPSFVTHDLSLSLRRGKLVIWGNENIAANIV